MDESAKKIVQDSPDMRASLLIALLLWLLPWVQSAMAYVFTPGSITPFFNHPEAQKVIIAVAVWQVLCCILIARTNNRGDQYLLALVSAPLVVLVNLAGPAFIMR